MQILRWNWLFQYYGENSIKKKQRELGPLLREEMPPLTKIKEIPKEII